MTSLVAARSFLFRLFQLRKLNVAHDLAVDLVPVRNTETAVFFLGFRNGVLKDVQFVRKVSKRLVVYLTCCVSVLCHLYHHDLSFFIFGEFVDLGDVGVGQFLDIFEAAAFFVFGDLFVLEHLFEKVV